MDNSLGLPLLLPFLADPGHVWLSLGAEESFISNGCRVPFIEGDCLKIGRSKVRHVHGHRYLSRIWAQPRNHAGHIHPGPDPWRPSRKPR